MRLTSAEVFSIVWDWIQYSPLHAEVPTMYPDKHPDATPTSPLTGEFIVVNSLTNVLGDMQVATVNVNIYVPDDTPTINKVEQRYPNKTRLKELTKIAYGSLQGYPITERWFFDVSSENIISEQGIPYSFANIKITFKKF